MLLSDGALPAGTVFSAAGWWWCPSEELPRHALLQGQEFHGKALPALLENNMFSQGDTLVVNFGLHHGTSTVSSLRARAV